MISPSTSVRLLSLLFLAFSSFTATATKILPNHADPSIILLNATYYSVESDGASLYIRSSPSLPGLANPAVQQRVWTDSAGRGDVWAPEMTTHQGRTYIHFSSGRDAKHRMYVISADFPLGAYGSEKEVRLPGDQWAIDGTFLRYEGKDWFVWSGWESEQNNADQNLYICEMQGPEKAVGDRHMISAPRESWEQGDSPLVNEGPEVIVDPEGRLHVVYSANGSWGDRYCLADLRLRKGGDPTQVWDWYKSNGCLFGSHRERMMKGWDETLFVNGPGHHTFALAEGDVGKSPGGTERIPFVFHGVDKGTTYSWANRAWYTGSFVWWSKTTYSRANVPGSNTDVGYSFKFSSRRFADNRHRGIWEETETCT